MHKDAETRIDYHDHGTPSANIPSLSMSSLKPSAPEVANVFHLPLAELVSPKRLHEHQFRGGTPYWALDVSDIVGGVAGQDWAGETPEDEASMRLAGERRAGYGANRLYAATFVQWMPGRREKSDSKCLLANRLLLMKGTFCQVRFHFNPRIRKI